jgi:hypothetical protein
MPPLAEWIGKRLNEFIQTQTGRGKMAIAGKEKESPN